MVNGEVDPHDPAMIGVTLWCVHGADCFPTIFTCRLTTGETGPDIWGYSVYKRSPGFRTLGRNLDAWMKEVVGRGCGPVHFFSDKAGAFALISRWCEPKVQEKQG